MKKLSVVISAYNEQEKIEECLKSVSFAEEIIVVNNSSTDKTEEIALKYTKKVFNHSNNPKEIDIQKNFGFGKATGDWILSLDADERIDGDLAEEIKKTINKNEEVNGYWIPRKNIIFGKWIEHTGWYPDNQLRLFKKGKGKYQSEHVHEHLKIDGKTGVLSNHILHKNYENITQFIQKMLIYVPNEANEFLKRGYKFSYTDAIRFPLNEFLNRFFAREGYKDGFYGLILSLLMAFYHFLIFVYIWEENNYAQVEGEDFIRNIKIEFGKVYKDISYWFLSIKIKTTKNYSKKMLLKLKRKFL